MYRYNLIPINEGITPDHFKMELLEPEKLIKANNLREITNPIFFIRDGVPTSDGLLSNEIFGISKDERANIFAYVELGDVFLHPLIYKIWSRMDKRIIQIVHGTKKFRVEKGDFVEDEENGDNGVSFLKKNIEKIKIRSTESTKRDTNIKFIEENKSKMFIKQYIIIPAYYRDVNSNGSFIGVGEINQLYDSLLIATKALKDSSDFGLTMSNATKGRIQEIILQIYNWFTKEPNLGKKHGIMRRSVLSKTADRASRLVLSAPNLRVEHLDDLMVNLDYSAVPLASLCSNLFPYIIFWVRRFFENEFAGSNLYPYKDKQGNVKYLKVKDPSIEFSDARIKKEIDRFMFGYSNRFIPIKVPNDENKEIYMKFKGRKYNVGDPDNINSQELINRRLTWCDLFYMAAHESAKDKYALLTRYPLDNYFGQFPTGIRVSSTKETEAVMYDNTVYRHYPKIRDEDIGKNTSNKFIDTLNMCNLFLGAIGGDYDGDQVSVKVAYTVEANEELKNYTHSKRFFINIGGQNVRKSSNEAIQSLYNLTLILPDDKKKLTEPKF